MKTKQKKPVKGKCLKCNEVKKASKFRYVENYFGYNMVWCIKCDLEFKGTWYDKYKERVELYNSVWRPAETKA